MVLGRTGLGGFMDAFLGNVANKVMEKVGDISVCLVGGKPEPGKVLVAMDQSEGAMRALDYVGSMMVGCVPRSCSFMW